MPRRFGRCSTERITFGLTLRIGLSVLGTSTDLGRPPWAERLGVGYVYESDEL
jgi:hypothetical protein